MGTSVIPVDLLNPGQVFACLGFLEAADVLCGPAEGGFAWDGETRDLCGASGVSAVEPTAFIVTTPSTEDPVATVLEFLAGAEVRRLAPEGWTPLKGEKPKGKRAPEEHQETAEAYDESADEDDDPADLVRITEFCSPEAEKMALPITIGGGNKPPIHLGHWADGSGRNTFKLYAGNRSAAKIAADMLRGTWTKGKKPKLNTKGVRQLWDDEHAALVRDPFGVLCPMGGSFNFDPRVAWTPIDVGYSPDAQDQKVMGSPVVQILAAWGLENARPEELSDREVRYAVWGCLLPPMLARAALVSPIPGPPARRFSFVLALSGKNKIVTFAQPLQEPSP